MVATGIRIRDLTGVCRLTPAYGNWSQSSAVISTTETVEFANTGVRPLHLEHRRH